MNDSTGIDSKDYNMQIFNNFNNKRCGIMNDKIREEFEPWWRSVDGDNYPFDKKRLCLQLWEVKEAENKKLRDLLEEIIDMDDIDYLDPSLRSRIKQTLKDGE